MTISVKFANAKEIEQALAELGDSKAVRRAVRAALREAGEPMAQLARDLVPRDEGNLERSIKMATAKRFRGQDQDQHGIVIGIDANEQPAQEVPRKERSKRGGTTYRDPGVAGVGPITEFGRPGKAAKPFMRPAFDAEGEKTIKRFGEVAGAAIEREAARLARKRAKAGGGG